jgi:hypothetical protein
MDRLDHRVRRGGVADVGDGAGRPCAAVEACPNASSPSRGRRQRCAPRGGIVGKHTGHRRQVADVAVHHPEKRGDGGLVGGNRIEIAHLFWDSRLHANFAFLIFTNVSGGPITSSLQRRAGGVFASKNGIKSLRAGAHPTDHHLVGPLGPRGASARMDGCRQIHQGVGVDCNRRCGRDQGPGGPILNLRYALLNQMSGRIKPPCNGPAISL